MVEGQRWRGRAANLALIRRAHMAQIKTLASDTRARGASPGRIPVGRSHQYSVGLSLGTCRWMQVRKRGGEGQQAVPKKPALWALEVQRNPGWLHNSRPIHGKRTCGRPIAREALNRRGHWMGECGLWVVSANKITDHSGTAGRTESTFCPRLP